MQKHTATQTYRHTNIQMHTHKHTCMHVHTQRHWHTNPETHTNAHVRPHTYTQHTQRDRNMHKNTHTHKPTDTNMNTHINTHTHTNTNKYTHRYVTQSPDITAAHLWNTLLYLRTGDQKPKHWCPHPTATATTATTAAPVVKESHVFICSSIFFQEIGCGHRKRGRTCTWRPAEVVTFCLPQFCASHLQQNSPKFLRKMKGIFESLKINVTTNLTAEGGRSLLEAWRRSGFTLWGSSTCQSSFSQVFEDFSGLQIFTEFDKHCFLSMWQVFMKNKKTPKWSLKESQQS